MQMRNSQDMLALDSRDDHDSLERADLPLPLAQQQDEEKLQHVEALRGVAVVQNDSKRR